MSKLVFDGQREGEEVEFIFRRHISTARGGLRFLIVMLIIGVSVMILWPGVSYMFWVFLGCVVLGLIGALYSYMLWYFSVYIVTDERIRQVSQKGLFKKSVIDLGLDRVQSISYEVPGFFSGIFNYGTILIQTAVGDLTISKVPKPEKVYNKLQNVIGKVKE